MKKAVMLICLFLGACTTPLVTLKNDKGQTVICGGDVSGSLSGGMIGYSIQKKNDEKCVEAYEKQGFVRVHQQSEEK